MTPPTQSDAEKRAILGALNPHYPYGVAVRDIADFLDMPGSLVAGRLRSLETAGLVQRQGGTGGLWWIETAGREAIRLLATREALQRGSDG